MLCEETALIYGSPVLLRGVPAASGSVPVQPSVSGGPLSGSDVVIRAGVIPFLQSLYPGYLPPQLQSSMRRADGPAFTIDSGNEKGRGFLQGTELAARVVSAYALLPTEIGTLVGGFVTFSTAARFAWDQLGALVATADTPPGQNRADSTVASSPTNDRGKKKKTTQPIRQRTNPPATAPVCTGQLMKTAVALGALSSLTAAGAIPASDSKTVRWIEVADAETLGKIGRDPAYPLDGRYRQGDDIDASSLSKPIGNETHPFIGEYDGRCHSVDKLGHCFVQKLDGNGRIDNVRFTRADIVSSEKAGVIACELSGHAALGNIQVEHSVVRTNRQKAPAGIGAGVAGRNTLIEGFSTFNCMTRTEGSTSPAGGVAGDAYGTIDNSRLYGALIETFGRRSDTGGGAGVVRPDANVTNTLLVNSSLLTEGSSTDAGGGGGAVRGTVVNTTMVGGQIKAIGGHVKVAVGAGRLGPDGELHNTTGYRVKIVTTGVMTEAAVGAGRAQGSVKGVVCFESSIATEGPYSDAGFGTGMLLSGFASPASAANIVASSCNVSASGDFSYVGFGGGRISRSGELRNLTVLYSRAESTGKWARSCIGGSDQVLVCDSSLGSKGESVPGCNDQTHDDCHLVAEDTCKLADRRVLTKNCQPVAPPYFDAEKGYRFVCPMALPTGVAPLATSLSTGVATLASSLSASAIAGIALGAVAIVLARVAGVCIYRHYHGRPSLADAGDTQELEGLKTVGRGTAEEPPNEQRYHARPSLADAGDTRELEVIKTVGQGAGEEPPNEQRRKIPSKSPRLKMAALPENHPMRPRDQFHEQLREQEIPRHEDRYENVGKNEDVGEYEDFGEYGYGDVGEYENVGEYGYGDVGEYENVDEYEDDGLYEEIETCKTGGRS